MGSITTLYNLYKIMLAITSFTQHFKYMYNTQQPKDDYDIQVASKVIKITREYRVKTDTKRCKHERELDSVKPKIASY